MVGSKKRRQGRYRFESFNETGDYQIRIADDQSLAVVGPQSVEVLISAGDVSLGGVNFAVLV